MSHWSDRNHGFLGTRQADPSSTCVATLLFFCRNELGIQKPLFSNYIPRLLFEKLYSQSLFNDARREKFISEAHATFQREKEEISKKLLKRK